MSLLKARRLISRDLLGESIRRALLSLAIRLELPRPLPLPQRMLGMGLFWYFLFDESW
jgi:hypothetical protein